jgi:hypothetical protein
MTGGRYHLTPISCFNYRALSALGLTNKNSPEYVRGTLLTVREGESEWHTSTLTLKVSRTT